ncbi:hypothetical protein GNP80_17800 [Aliivibrio fischeri]|uniref:hypothetical protein n=1 Tax=Aliivibrio fischeri TaxID=668 RepID=UPI0007C58FCB|nr:hypothetical protein [Aliivibrio fischeri]MUK94281.1 hypothetical protein [Aliivibrio fischeri]
MRKIIKRILLLFPLYWFVLLWCWHVFNIPIDFGIIYDDEYDGYGPKPLGLIPNSLALFFLFIGTPLMFFVGSIYSAYKKLWWWFGAYMVLGGGLWFYLG